MEKNTTIEDLALMVAKGFEETAKAKEVNERLDNIEEILLKDYGNRIKRLEDQVKELQSDYRQLLGIKKL